MLKYAFRLIAGFFLFLLGLRLMGQSAYMSTIPIVSVAAALFGLLMVVVGLMMMVRRPFG